MKFLRLIFFLILVMNLNSISQVQPPKDPNSGKETIDKDSERDYPLEREKHFIQQRAYPFSEIPEGARLRAFQQMEKMTYEKNSSALMLAQQPQWKNIGPFSIGGRIKSVVCHPTQSGTVYVGAAAGGVWKTTDGGANWTPIFDTENALAFGSLAIDMNNPDIIYAGTGEAVMGGNSYLGAGLFKTTDGGTTWKVVGLTEVGAFSKVWVHPKNSNLVFAGAIKRGQGFYRSTDAGATWRKTYDGPVSDVSININNENEVLIGVTGTGIMFSSDAGQTFTLQNTGLESGIGRVSVQFAPSNPDICYSLMEINGIGTIYRSTNHGQGWTISYKGSSSFFNGQGFYDNYIVIHPKNSNVVLAGGIDIYRTIDGNNWTNVTNGYSGGSTHVDQHHACFDPLSPNIVYAGNDGGMYKSVDNGMDWSVINNNLQVTQFYSIAVDYNQENLTYGGTQDNGTLGSNAANNAWQGVVGGDGFRTLVDVDDPNVIYGESTPGGSIAPYKYNVKTNAFSYINKGLPTQDGIWDPPLVQDPVSGYILFHGRQQLWASFDNGSNWDAISPKDISGFITAIAVSSVDDNYIIAGTAIGEVIITKDGATSWKNVTGNGLVNRWVKDFAFSKKDPKTCWAVFSGFGVPHVFKTTNAGDKWENISTGLPDIPTNTIAVHPENEDILFIGTDVGVFATFDGGKSWFPYGRGMARSPVTDLQFNTYYLGDNSIPLRAATHGRSIWQVDVTTETISSPEITAPVGGELYTSGVPQTISWYGFTPPVLIELSVDEGLSWSKIAENVQGLTMGWVIPNRPSISARIRVTSMTDQSQVKISNPFTINLEQIGSVLKIGGVSYIPYGLAYDGKNGLWSTSFQTNKLTKLNADNFTKEKEFTLPGDSLFSDLTMDRQNGILYIHRMNSTQGNGGIILVVDTTGKLIRQLTSPGKYYPIGLELVDGNLLCGDRDYKDDAGNLLLWFIDPATGSIIKSYKNPFQRRYGPRGLCYDGTKYVYQVCTDFPNGGGLTAAYIYRMDKNALSTEDNSMNLESLDGIINGRGIDYDPRDDNFWISDYGGNIYKIAGFNTVTEVQEDQSLVRSSSIETKVFPNPASDFVTISVKAASPDVAEVSVRLTNMLGEQVANIMDKSLNLNDYGNTTISTTNLPAGVYNLVFFVNGRQDITRKLVVVK